MKIGSGWRRTTSALAFISFVLCTRNALGVQDCQLSTPTFYGTATFKLYSERFGGSDTSFEEHYKEGSEFQWEYDRPWTPACEPYDLGSYSSVQGSFSHGQFLSQHDVLLHWRTQGCNHPRIGSDVDFRLYVAGPPGRRVIVDAEDQITYTPINGGTSDTRCWHLSGGTIFPPLLPLWDAVCYESASRALSGTVYYSGGDPLVRDGTNYYLVGRDRNITEVADLNFFDDVVRGARMDGAATYHFFVDEGGAPTVALQGPCLVQVGQPATFTAIAEDPDDETLCYQWTAEGATVSGQGTSTATMTWEVPGDYQVSIEVIDPMGRRATDESTVSLVQTKDSPSYAEGGGPECIDSCDATITTAFLGPCQQEFHPEQAIYRISRPFAVHVQIEPNCLCCEYRQEVLWAARRQLGSGLGDCSDDYVDVPLLNAAGEHLGLGYGEDSSCANQPLWPCDPGPSPPCRYGHRADPLDPACAPSDYFPDASGCVYEMTDRPVLDVRGLCGAKLQAFFKQEVRNVCQAEQPPVAQKDWVLCCEVLPYGGSVSNCSEPAVGAANLVPTGGGSGRYTIHLGNQNITVGSTGAALSFSLSTGDSSGNRVFVADIQRPWPGALPTLEEFDTEVSIRGMELLSRELPSAFSNTENYVYRMVSAPHVFRIPVPFPTSIDVTVRIGKESVTVSQQMPIDPDGDGVANPTDNCPFLGNPGQENSDGDALGDACDCAAGDPGNGSPPTVGSALRVNETDGMTEVSWNDDGIEGPFHVYRGWLNPGGSWSYNHYCAGAAVPEATWIEPLTPNPYTLFYYLVTRLGCGESIPGEDAAGSAIPNLDPCPSAGTDADSDGTEQAIDNCPMLRNEDQADVDIDGHGDICDNCPSALNPYQEDLDDDGLGDPCDRDIDGDGVENASDNCPRSANTGQEDGDGDGVGDPCDNCPEVTNPEQEDSDKDGLGDSCDR